MPKPERDKGTAKQNPRGRPIKNVTQQIPEKPEQIAKAIFRAADKKIQTLK